MLVTIAGTPLLKSGEIMRIELDEHMAIVTETQSTVLKFNTT